MIQVNQGRTRTTHSRVWGCFNGGSFSLELELGEVNSILCTRIFTEKGVGVLQLWLFLSGVRTQRSWQCFMYTDMSPPRPKCKNAILGLGNRENHVNRLVFSGTSVLG